MIFAVKQANEDKDVKYKSMRSNAIIPTHYMVKQMAFEGDTAFEEAKLVNAMAELADKTGMSANDVAHLIPAVLRMLKVKSPWTE